MADREPAGFDDQLLAELLLSAKLLTPEQLEEAQARLTSHDLEGAALPVPRAFVADSLGLRVQVLDPASGTEEAHIPLGEAPGDPGEWPRWSAGQVLVVDPEQPGMREFVATPPGVTLGLFPTQEGGCLYPGAMPTRDLSPSVQSLFSPLVAPSAVNSRPLDLTAAPGGAFMVAANRGAGTVHVLVPESGTQIGALAIRSPGAKRGMGVAIHDRLAYITDGLTPRLTIVELTTLKMRQQTFPTGPLGPVAVTPDGQFLLLGFYKGTDDLGLLTVTTADLRVRHLLNLPGRKIQGAPLEPFRVVPSGQLAYMALQDGDSPSRYRLVAIDLGRKRVAREWPLDALPLALALPAPKVWLPEQPTLEQVVIELGYATANEIDQLEEAQPSGPPLLDPRLDPQVVGQVPERLMRAMGIVPMYREGAELLVALVSPRDPTALQLASQLAGGLQLRVVPIGQDELSAFLSDRYPGLMERFLAVRSALGAGGAQAAGTQATGTAVGGQVPPAGASASTSGASAEASQAPAGRGAPGGMALAGAPAPAASTATTGAAPAGALPASVRPARSATASAPVKSPESKVKEHPASIDAWATPDGRVLLVDAIRRQVVGIGRDKREIWAQRNVVAGGATWLSGGHVLVVDSSGGKVLEFQPRSSDPVWELGGGDRAKALRSPKSASKLANGNVLVADTGNHRVAEFTPAGEIVWSYGESGKAGCAHGSLFKPQGAWRDRNGNTLIADTGNHRIVEVTEAGEVVWQYGNSLNRLGGGQGSGVNQLSEPAMAVRIEGGNVLIADTGNQRVLEVDGLKQILWHYRPGGAKGGSAVRDPQCVARLGDRHTLIAGRSGVVEVDSDLRIVWEYHLGGSRDGSATASPGAAAIGRDQVAEPQPLSTAQDLPINLPATFLLVDRMRSRILEIDRKMQVVWQFTGLGGGERNRIDHPHFAARLANANTLVADTNHHRVVEVRENAIVWQFGRRGEEGDSLKQLSSPRSAERTPAGTTVIADYGNRRVMEINAAQECVWRRDNLAGPSYCAKLPGGNVLIVDWGGHMVLEVDERGLPVWQYGQLGNNGKGPNQLFHPEHASRLENGNTLISDTQNHRVLEVSPDKRIVWQYGGESEFLGRKGRFAMQMLTPVVAWRLPNGRTMVHHAGANHVVEVDADLNIVWHFTLTF